MENFINVLIFLGRTLHEPAEFVGPSEFLEKLLSLVSFWMLIVDQIRLILNQQARNTYIRCNINVFLDQFLPFNGLLDSGSVSGRANYDASLLTKSVPRAPRRYIFETALKRSCPAISQSCKRMGLPSIVDLSLAKKSQPMVGRTF